MPQGGLPSGPDKRSLADVLAGLLDSMFPADMGETAVTVNSRGYDGDMPLHVLLWRGDMHGIRLLIEAGADVNARGEMQETPLHIAVRQRNLEAIKWLLAAGADDRLISEFGVSPKGQAALLGSDISAYFSRR